MIERAVSETIARETDLVRATAVGRPKAWGTLAAAGVIRFKQLEGRPPTEAERREIWAALWRAAAGVARG